MKEMKFTVKNIKEGKELNILKNQVLKLLFSITL